MSFRLSAAGRRALNQAPNHRLQVAVTLRDSSGITATRTMPLIPYSVSRYFMEVPTVVSGTGRQQPLTESPTAISVVTADRIRESGATSIPDALRFVPGLDVMRNSASDVFIGAPRPTQPIATLGGRSIVLGYQGWLFNFSGVRADTSATSLATN